MTGHRGAPSRDALLDAVLQRAPLAVYAYDRDGICTYATGAVYDTLGVDVSRLVGSNLFDRHPDDHEYHAQLRRPLAGETVQFQFREGAAAVLELWLAPLYDDGGDVSGAIGIGVDVTERVLAERGRDLYQAFVSAAPQFIAIAGLDGRVRYVNPGGRALAGIPDDTDVASTTIADYLTPDGLALSLAVEQPAVIAQGSYAGEATLRHWPTETGIPVHVDSFLVRQPGTGEPVALATVQTDIREVVAARQALEDSVARQRGLIVHMHEAQETERRRLAADVHDDTLQVLAGANLRLQGLRRRASELGADDLATAAESLDREVRAASDRLRRLLFELEPTTAGSPGDLGDRIRAYARATVESGTPRVIVEVDPAVDPSPVVAQVLYRIAQQALANAAKHAAASTVMVQVRTDGSAFTLTVTDDGRGLPREPGPDAAGRGGLRGMVDRAESAGGSCTVMAGPDGGGTQVTARIPGRIGDLDASTHRATAWAFLEQTMESIGEGFAAIDNEWRYVYVNRLGEQAMGRGPGELIGRVLWEVFDVPLETERAFRRAREEMRALTFQAFDPTWDRWFENRVFPSESGVSVFFRDITAQKQHEITATEQGRLIETGREVVTALRDEPDLTEALTRAAEAVRRGWGVPGVRVATAGAAGREIFEVTVGERAAAEQYDVPLLHAGARVGTVTLLGPHGAGDEDLLALFALRIAAG
jgi:PAS domain S-box-containing protein